MKWRVCATTTLLCSIIACTPMLRAQDAPPSAWARGNDASSTTTSTRVAWTGAWSPLRPVSDIARGELRAPFGPGLLDAPAPMVGPFILAGAPGSLVRDLAPRLRGDSARFGELRAQRASEAGSFHRPLDNVTGAATQVSGFGWSPVGARGIAIGHFAVDQEQNDTSSFTQRVSPSWSSPFIATDSVRPPMVRTRARLEGALGLRLGEYGVGLSAGVDSREGNSLDFPLRRTGRWAMQGAMTGVERQLPWFGARISAFARWTESAETNILNPSPLNTVIYSLQGYDEPLSIPVANATLFVRNERRATARGGSLAFELARTQVVVTHEAAQRADDQYRLITARVRPTDSWRASGSEQHVQLARLFGTRVRATVVAAHTSLTGQGRRSDLGGTAVTGTDAQTAIEGDVRLTLGDWMLGALGGFTRRTQTRHDYVAALTADVEVSTPFVGLEAARQFGASAVSIGVSMASTAPTAAIPPANRGPNYQRLIAPGLAYDAAEATATAEWITMRQTVSGHALSLQLRAEHASPKSVLTPRLQPSGDRTRWQMSFGYRP